MTGSDWLRRVETASKTALPQIDVTRTDDSTMSLALRLHVAVLHVTEEMGILAPSYSAGGSIASRLENSVQHLEPTSYRLDEVAADAAVTAILAHLRP